MVKIKLKLLYETVYSQERLKQNSKCFTGKWDHIRLAEWGRILWLGGLLRYIELKVSMRREFRVGNFDIKKQCYRKNTCENIFSYQFFSNWQS